MTMTNTMTKIDQARRLAQLACEAYLHDEADEAERLYTQAAEIYAGMGCDESEREMRAFAVKYGPSDADRESLENFGMTAEECYQQGEEDRRAERANEYAMEGITNF